MSASPDNQSSPLAAAVPPAASPADLSTPLADVPAVKAKPKRKYRRRPATNAKREINRAQKGTNRLVPAKAIDRVVRQIAKAVADQPLRFTGGAISALHEAAEAYLIGGMGGAAANADENNRKTISVTDLQKGLKVTS